MTSTTTVDRSPWTGAATPDELERWTAVAHEVGERLAAGALERDRTNANPREALGLLRDANRGNPEGLRQWLRRAGEEILLIRAQRARAESLTG